MGFLESVGYIVIILITIVVLYIITKLLPLISTLVATIIIYQFIITGMALPGKDPTNAHVIAVLIYLVGTVLGLIADMVLFRKRAGEALTDSKQLFDD